MTIRTHHLAGALPILGLFAALVLGARPVSAQCSMMGGGGGSCDMGKHGAAAKASASDRKLQKSIDRLLTSERGRILLADALLRDREFMLSLFTRVAGTPDVRALALERLAQPAAESAPPPPSLAPNAAPAPVSAQSPALYVCPMHSDVTSTTPGNCPKCGMKLELASAGRK